MLRAREMLPLKREDTKVEDCRTWLREYLAGKTLPCEEVRDAALKAGFTKRELQVARAQLGVIPGSVTTWSLPEDNA